MALPAWLTLLVVLAAGGLMGGLLNGVLVARLKLSVFVVTLASMTALTGVIQLWTGSSSTFLVDPFFIGLGTGQFLGLAIPIWIMVLALALAFYVERFTYFGRDIYAVGGNIVAAELSGIRTERTLIAVYAVAGAAAALGGVIGAGRIGAATAQVDGFLALQAIAGVLLGGTLLTGGAGSVIGTALGVLFIGGLSNYLSITGVPQAWQQVMTGAVLVLAVASDRLRGRAPRRSAEKRPRQGRAPNEQDR
jgi:ribose transport system permease protein